MQERKYQCNYICSKMPNHHLVNCRVEVIHHYSQHTIYGVNCALINVQSERLRSEDGWCNSILQCLSKSMNELVSGSKSAKVSQSVTHMSKNKTRYLLIKPMFYTRVLILLR